MDKKYFATCPKGLEQLLEDELKELGALKTKQTVAGVFFGGSEELGYKACLWSRFASRILLPIATFPADNAEDLYRGVSRIRWQDHMAVSTTFLVNFIGKSEAIKHTQFAAQKIKDAIVDQFRAAGGNRPSVDKIMPMLRINAQLKNDIINLSIDLSGESLHRRGYRLQGTTAPIKENLAAAILKRARWPEIAKEGGSLIDPMCGSGTILIEGLLMAADIAPGLQRAVFGFEGWRQFDKGAWNRLVLEAQERASQGKKKLLSTFHGFDVDDNAISIAEENIKRAGLSSYISVNAAEISQLTKDDIPAPIGLCISNPPYGERLEDETTLLPLYRSLSQKLKGNFLNWEAAILTGNTEVSRNMGLRAYKKYAFFNGTIPCQLLLFHVKPEWFIESR